MSDKSIGFINNLIVKVKKPWNSWIGFWQYCIVGFIVITIFDTYIAESFNKIFSPPLEYRKFIVLSTYIFPFSIYLILFIFNRIYTTKIRLSRKVNIVLAYNIKGINAKKFNIKYNNFRANLENEIKYCNLGNKVKVIQCPPDVNLKGRSAAEAKALMGLKGSTLLVWGYIEKMDKNYRFNTQFSFEFGYPRFLKSKDIQKSKKIFIDYIENIMGKGLFSSIKMDLGSFKDQLIPASFFILSVTTFTLHLWDKSELFLNAFKEKFQQMNALRKKEVAHAYIEVNFLLVMVNRIRINDLISEFDLHAEKIEEFTQNILAIDRRDYFANVSMAFYCAHTGDSQGALHYNKIAEYNAPNKQYLHVFNEAYFALCEGDYSKVINIYNKIPDYTSVNVGNVSVDLYMWYNKTKDLAFLFAEGYVNYRWHAEKLGKKILKEFLRKAKNNSSYKIFIEESIKILKN